MPLRPSFTLAALFLAGCASLPAAPGMPSSPAPSAPDGSRDGLARSPIVAEQPSCGITASAAEGPYYVSGMPALQDGNLNTSNLPGEPLRVSGHIHEGLDASKPIANAVVDLWQADNDGRYHPNGNGPASGYAAGELALRGTVTTDEDGRYAFTTIHPGEYSGRTRHIHVKVRAPGFEELTTQLIVPSRSDDGITFDEDAVSRGLPDCHLLTIDGTTDPASATFDFRLAR